MNKILIYITCFIVLINTVGCTTTRPKKRSFDKPHNSVKMEVKGYYFNKELKDLFVYANNFLFHFSLSKANQRYFKEILNQEDPVMPKISKVKIDSKGEVSARLHSDQASFRGMTINGELLKSKKELIDSMVSPKTLATFYIKMPKNKAEVFLGQIAKPIDYVIRKTANFAIDGTVEVVMNGILLGLFIVSPIFKPAGDIIAISGFMSH